MKNRLVLVINMAHIAEESRLTIGKSYIQRCINNGTLSEDDVTFFLNDDEELLVEEVQHENHDSPD